MKELILKYNQSVPRYTSYPTAPHFTPVKEATAQDWLTSLAPREPVSLYIHIPYCREMCWYCGCHTQATRKYAPVAGYITLLEQEINLLSEHLGFTPRLSHLHFGGGSPSMLEPADFERLMAALGQKFIVDDDAELALESDPRGADRARVQAYARHGINRASLGIQDFTPAVQQAINRVQDFATVENAVRLFREAGIAALNFDLMYGLPLQSVDNLLETVDLSLKLAPQRIALFGYAHVPWMKKHMRLINDRDLPSGSARLDQFDAAAERLSKNGYHAVGLDHFVREDDPMWQALNNRKLARNFQGYTTDLAPALLGLGVSAISKYPQGYLQNASDMVTYKKMIEAGNPAALRGRALTDDDRLRAEIISDLMCYFDADLLALLTRHDKPVDYFDTLLRDFDDLIKDGFVTIKSRHIRINPKARQLARVVAARFDSYFQQSAKRHAQAA